MAKIFPYVAAAWFSLAPNILAADISEVRADMDYVVANGTKYDYHRLRMFQLSVDGNKVGLNKNQKVILTVPEDKSLFSVGVQGKSKSNPRVRQIIDGDMGFDPPDSIDGYVDFFEGRFELKVKETGPLVPSSGQDIYDRVVHSFYDIIVKGKR